jgi:DNA-binding IclR family transcriptional regulator
VQILEFLAAQPLETFTFSELRQHLDMSNGTLHSLLASLTASAYVRRSPRDLSYSLGPAVITLGAAARAGYRFLDDLIPEMEHLSAELGVTCHATVARHDEMVVVGRTGPEEPFGRRVRVGERFPLVPPLGTAYIAWSDPAGIEAYLARSRPPLNPADLRRCRRALDEVRRRGYSIALDPSTRRKVGEMMDRGDLPPRNAELGALLARLAHEEYVLAALEPASTYDVMAITAPVLGPDGLARAMIALANFPHPIRADEIPHLAARLRMATGSLSGPAAGPR